MGWPVVALWGLTTLLLATAYRVPDYDLVPPIQKHVPDDDVPTFQRSSVESLPYSASFRSENDEYGSHSLPLRTAVEALPDFIGSKSQPLRDAVERIPEKTGARVPLRDAVEHRTAPFYGGLSHESLWLERLSPPTIRRNNQKYPTNVVCHLESGAFYRSEPFSLTPQEIPSRKCTHLVYRSATLDPHELTVIPRDPEYDVVKGGYTAALGLRKKDPSLSVLISIVSPDHGRLFAELTRGYKCCEIFAQSIIDFLEKYEFDGIEIDWDVGSNEQLKRLLNSLYGPLSSSGFTVALAARPNNPPDRQLASMVDLLFLQAWRAPKGKFAIHPAPLNFAISVAKRWIDARVDPTKIILGVPLFGISYTLKFKNSTDLGAPIAGPGIEGLYTKRRGSLAYYEICEKLEDRWTYGRDEEGSYVKRGDQWIGYDDPISIKLKAAYIKSVGLGGISLTSLDLDDFVGMCGEPWPMLNAAIKIFGNQEEPVMNCLTEGNLFNDPSNCAGYLSCENGKFYRRDCGPGRFFDAATERCVKANPEVCKAGWSFQDSSLSQNSHHTAVRDKQRSQNLQIEQKGPRVVCYITSWALYRKGEGKFVPEQLDTRLCTDVIYAFAGLNPETLQIQPFDPWADIDNNLYERATSLKGPRVLLGLGGWTDSTGDKYSRLINSPTARREFVTSTVNFLRRYGFDGLSFEWHYPTCWQSNCGKGPKSDRPNLTKFLQELRREFDAAEPKLSLAVAVSSYKEIIDVAYDFREISEAVQFISVMSYDYHGAWERRAGHLAPLYGSPGDINPYYNVNFTMNYIASLGAKRSKLLVGIPFYGQTYQLIRDEWYKLGEPVSGAGEPGEFTRQPGMLSYYEICYRVKRQNWEVERGPSAHKRDQMVVYDDPKSINEKGRWIMENGFGGATAWTVDLDDFNNRCCQGTFPLLRSLNYVLGGHVGRPPTSENCERPPEPVTPQAPILTTHSDAYEGGPTPTRPMVTSTTTKATTWPTWTEKPSNRPITTASTAWTWTSTIRTTTTPRLTTAQFTTASRPIETNPTPGSSPIAGTTCHTGQHIADPMNCGSYFRCVLGELKREQCAPGLHWADSQGRCDWPVRAKCQQGLSTSTQKPGTTPTPMITAQKPTVTMSWKPPTTTTSPATSTGVDSFTEMAAKECEHGQYYAYPNSCTNFLICVNGNLVNQQCGPGLNWNEEKNMCDWAFKNPCKPKKNAALTMKDQDQVQEECITGSFSGVPGDCESYHACLWGRHEKFQCAPGLHFNEESHICDWPARAKCKDQTVEAPPPSVDVPVYEKPSTQRPATSQRPVKPVTIGTTQKPWSEWTTQKPLPPSEVDPNKVSPLSGHYKVVCYFTNWAWYRKGIGRYLPEHIDHTLCTHIVYGFAVLDYSNLVIKAHDSWADFDNRFYERVVAYKQRGLKVLLALGGWNDSAGDKYSRLVNSPASRKKFIEHAVQFVEKYGFDGLDLDWEYPVCWQVDCHKGPKSDKQAFAEFLKELSAVFKPRGLLLSSAVSPSKTVIDEGYDVPTLAKYLDWIAVMTYDFHGQWEKKTGHVAPLFYHKDDEFYFFNANYSINYWISKGAPPRSLVMGMPLYGQAFTINDPSAGTGLSAPASAGTAGEFTKAAGFLAYYEICDRIRNRGWQVVQDPERRMGPYAYKGSQWVSFDDADMIRQKAQFVRDMGLGGGMVWALDLDDFRGRCGGGSHPLMNTLQQVLAEPPNKHDRPIKPPAIGQELEWKLPKAPSMSASQMLDKVMHKEDEYKVVCYFTNWAWYRQEGGRYVPEDIDADLCTHIVYGFAVLDGTTLTVKTHDSWADIDNKFYERVVAYKAKGIKVSLAIGGWNDSAGDKYSRLANSAAARARFISHVVQFIEKYGFEGLDLDWEYPVCWQVDCNKGPASDKESFSLLVKELSKALKPKGLLLSSAVSPSKRVISEGYDVPTLAQYLDWIAVMTYDFHGQWDKKTGHVAPLYEHPLDWEPTFNANYSINYWIEQGAPPKKLVMGAPLYGQSFSLAERGEQGLNAPTYGGGEAGDATRARGFLAYYEICERTLRKGWTVIQDPERRMGPYAYRGDQWVSFDDAEQIRLKSEYIKQMGLGGGMVWALDLDDFKNRCGCEPMPLLRTMNRVLRNYPAGPDCRVTAESMSETPAITTEKPMDQPTKPGTKPSTSDPSYLPPSTTDGPPDLTDTIAIDAGPQPPSIPPIGECDGRIFIPHKDDCSKYLICNFGELSEQSCPNGLHWNEDRCDWPENSKCNKELKPNEESNVIPEVPAAPTSKPTTISEQTTSSYVEQLIDGTEDRSGTKLVCYFTNWAWYRPGSGKYLPENIDPKLCTHIVYGFTVLDSEQLVIKMHDSWADIDNDFYGRVTAYRAKGIKVLVALGGWNDSLGDKYSRLVNNPSARKKFIKHALMFVEKYGFDGLDLDWEYPVCWQVDCNRGPASDKESFGALVRELSDEFKPRNLLLSAAVSPSKRVIDKGYDVPTLGKYLDWIAVMTYDFHGHWEKKTGHVAPLYYYPGDEFDYFNANFSMRYWIEKGAPASRLVMGVPLYGQSFSLSNTATKGLEAEASGPGEAGQFTRAGGFLAFYEICDNVKNGGWEVTKDPEGRIGPYATRGNQWVGYDDVTNIARKAAFIRELGIAGGMIWALDLDDFNNSCGCGKYPLLSALNNALRGQQVATRDCT